MKKIARLKKLKFIRIPKKKSKNNPLTKEDKISNKEKSSSRIYAEHINSNLYSKYCNRRKIVGLILIKVPIFLVLKEIYYIYTQY